jgi:hypothetical protein
VTSEPALWHRVAKGVDEKLKPALEGAAQHDLFGVGYALAERGRRAMFHRTERLSRRLLHSLNLPSASDVNRLLLSIASVEHQVRLLTNEVEDRMPLTREVRLVSNVGSSIAVANPG